MKKARTTRRWNLKNLLRALLPSSALRGNAFFRSQMGSSHSQHHRINTFSHGEMKKARTTRRWNLKNLLRALFPSSALRGNAFFRSQMGSSHSQHHRINTFSHAKMKKARTTRRWNLKNLLRAPFSIFSPPWKCIFPKWIAVKRLPRKNGHAPHPINPIINYQFPLPRLQSPNVNLLRGPSCLGAFVVNSPVICFGQQPCGFFPKRFLVAKILTARRIQSEMGGEIVFFYHDADHDFRETKTTLRHRRFGDLADFNFDFDNKLQRKYSPPLPQTRPTKMAPTNHPPTPQLRPPAPPRPLQKRPQPTCGPGTTAYSPRLAGGNPRPHARRRLLPSPSTSK